MKNWNEFTHFAGIDWAKNKHEVVILNQSGKIVAQSTITHDAAGWQNWNQSIASYRGKLAVCVETNQGAVIERLLQRGGLLVSRPIKRRKQSNGSCSWHSHERPGIDGVDHSQHRFAEGHYPASVIFEHGYNGNCDHADGFAGIRTSVSEKSRAR